MLVGGAALFLLIRAFGDRLTPEAAGAASSTAALGANNLLLHLLMALAVIIVTARAVGILFKAIGQPAVIGEIVGGLLLGPSVLGRIAPDVAAYLFPVSLGSILNIVSQLGIILYMFLVGLELDAKVLRHNGRATVAVSHASILFPFILGSALALALYSKYAGPGISFTGFALFLGMCMSITAFPVLARILSDRGLTRTRMGNIALACAAIDDVTAWCLLALVVSIVQSDIGNAVQTIGLTVTFIVFVLFVLRPAAARLLPWMERHGRLAEAGTAALLVAVLLSALATEFIGIHALFGAFLLGAVLPRQSKVTQGMTAKLEDVVRVMLLPAFFAYTGLRTEFGLLSSGQDWLICALIIVVATVGKFGGTLIAGRLTGLRPRDAAGLGVLMNTRGLVELIALNIGLDLGIISPRLFAMLVLMALATTIAAAPVLERVTRKTPWLAERTTAGVIEQT